MDIDIYLLLTILIAFVVDYLMSRTVSQMFYLWLVDLIFALVNPLWLTGCQTSRISQAVQIPH